MPVPSWESATASLLRYHHLQFDVDVKFRPMKSARSSVGGKGAWSERVDDAGELKDLVDDIIAHNT